MKNKQRFQEAVEKYSQQAYLQRSQTRAKFLAETSSAITKAIDGLAAIVVAGELDDPSEILMVLDQLEAKTSALIPKHSPSNELRNWKFPKT